MTVIIYAILLTLILIIDIMKTLDRHCTSLERSCNTATRIGMCSDGAQSDAIIILPPRGISNGSPGLKRCEPLPSCVVSAIVKSRYRVFSVS